ncbi:hypothetical protein [Chitinimonas sp.]|uniref:hypothetical protein n=1 Tax=Chitinimonas sp. TaxID=1934313 RepID=UPI002F9231D1
MRAALLLSASLLLPPLSGCASLADDEAARVKLSYVCSGDDVGQCNYVLFSEGRRVSSLLRLKQGQSHTLENMPVSTRFCMSSGDEPFPDPRTCRQFHVNGRPVSEPTSV